MYLSAQAAKALKKLSLLFQLLAPASTILFHMPMIWPQCLLTNVSTCLVDIAHHACPFFLYFASFKESWGEPNTRAWNPTPCHCPLITYLNSPAASLFEPRSLREAPVYEAHFCFSRDGKDPRRGNIGVTLYRGCIGVVGLYRVLFGHIG